MSNFCCKLQSWQRNYAGVPFGRRTLCYFHVIDRCVIAGDALGRPPAAVAFAVSVDGLKLSTWIVWPTWRTWWIREVDMVNQWSWLCGAVLRAMLRITIEAGFQAMSHAHKPADTVWNVCVCACVYFCFLDFCAGFWIRKSVGQKQWMKRNKGSHCYFSVLVLCILLSFGSENRFHMIESLITCFNIHENFIYF